MSEKAKTKRTGDFKEYVIASLRDDPKLASEYLNAAMEDSDVQVFLMALGDLAKARGMSSVSKKTGLNRENIYRIVSTNGNPQIKSVFALLDALGLKLKTEPTRPVRRTVKQAA
jgi:probable addiction module antidote protein